MSNFFFPLVIFWFTTCGDLALIVSFIAFSAERKLFGERMPVINTDFGFSRMLYKGFDIELSHFDSIKLNSMIKSLLSHTYEWVESQNLLD